MRSQPDETASPPARELLVVGLLGLLTTLIAVALFFGPGILSGAELFFTLDGPGSDFWHMNYPYRSFYAAGLEEGRLPLWCPDVSTGFPLLAEGQVSALYPPNLALYSLLPLPAALNWEILLHLALAGAFTAMFARQRGAGRGGSVLAAVIFALSGFLLVHLKHTNMITAAAWLPLLLLLLERFAERRRPGTFALLAVAVGAMCLGGHPQLAYYNLLVAAVYAVCLLRGVYREGCGPRRVATVSGAWLAAVLLGILLASPQLLPAWELKGLGPRKGGLSLDEATRWDYAPRHLVNFLSPKAFGDPAELREVAAKDPETGRLVVDPATGRPHTRLDEYGAGPDRTHLFWEVTAYVGLLPLGLALLAVASLRSRPRVRLVLGLLGLGLLLALGRHLGVHTLLRSVVPGFDLFRFSGRFLLYAVLGLAVLAGIGLTAAAARIPVRWKRPARPVLVLTALAVCFLDLWIAFGDHNRQVDADRWLRSPPTARRIREEEAARGEPFRVATIDPERLIFLNAYHRARGWKGDLEPYEPAWNVLHPSLSLMFGLDNVHVHSPSVVTWASDVTGLLLYPEDSRTGRPGVTPQIAALLNVRYFVDPLDGLLGQLPPLAEYPGDELLTGPFLADPGTPYTIRLYRNPSVLPRAFLVPRARSVDGAPARPGSLSPGQKALIAPDFDPRLEILIAGDLAGEPVAAPDPPRPIERPVEFLEYFSHRVRLGIDAPRDCWLFTSDAYYPGWEAEVDDEPRPIFRANVGGRAVRVPAGRHEVVFIYRPAPFRRGLFLAAGALLAIGAVLVVGRVRRGRSPPR